MRRGRVGMGIAQHLAADDMQVAFFLPQLVQLLRSDDNGMIRDFLLAVARSSALFAHHLLCTLRVRRCSERKEPKGWSKSNGKEDFCQEYRKGRAVSPSSASPFGSNCEA